MSDEEKDYIAAPSPTEQMVASKPPRARVEDAVDPDEESAGEKLARKRDYLDGFLKKKPEASGETGAGGALQEAVIAALKEIYDPEIPVNIYDLGLIYGVEVDEEQAVAVTMTLTSPMCPVAGSLPPEIQHKIEGKVERASEVKVEVIWDPPWNTDMMSEAAKLELGMM